jgi:hypothetical protein
MSKEIYTITNLNGYASQMREVAANSFVDTNQYTDSLDDYITIEQITNMIRTECLGFDDKNRPLLDEDSNERIFENTTVWIHNSALAKLAAQDLIECAWDNDSNDMVFWVKDKESNNVQQKPKSNRKNKKSKG